MKIESVNFMNRKYLRISAPDCRLDRISLNMLEDNKISWFIKGDLLSNGVFCYDISGMRNLSQYFDMFFDTETMLSLVEQIALIFEDSDELMLEEGQILLSPERVFVENEGFRLKMLCLPVLQENVKPVDRQCFIADILEKITLSDEEDEQIKRELEDRLRSHKLENMAALIGQVKEYKRITELRKIKRINASETDSTETDGSKKERRTKKGGLLARLFGSRAAVL